jgi:hypothetical protein
MSIREFEPSDLPAVDRIWRECGWIDDDDDTKALEGFFSIGKAFIATVEGGTEAECSAHHTPGHIYYQDEALPLGAVTAITTSRIARKLGLAQQLTARLLAYQAESGMAVSALGMFEQGFYDRVGFGTGSYENWVSFDPAQLTVDGPFRVPQRLTDKDYTAVHRAMLRRNKVHGSVCLTPPEIMRAEMQWTEDAFGLGYSDGPDGELSHFIWGSTKNENGPYTISSIAYENGTQLLELLALVKSLGDQVHAIGIIELPELQLQDLLKQPFRNRRISTKGQFEQSIQATAYWQLRILDLSACLAATRLNTPGLRFNLELTDPVETILAASGTGGWQGIAGSYVVELGSQSSALPGTDSSLPTLKASVNAFSRLWFGIRPASSLDITDQLRGDADLLAALDRTIRLPKAQVGWDF